MHSKMAKIRDLRYRAYVGPADKYDLISVNQFTLLVTLGLRDTHYLMDIGCGSLAGGRLFIPYLLPERYFGIEPSQWLIQEGIRNELGEDIIRIKRPTFSNDYGFNLSAFHRKFDFLLAQSIFSHASQRQIRKCLSEARQIMTKNSLFVSTFVEAEVNYDGDDWVYPDFITYTRQKMMRLFKDHGFLCSVYVWPHPCLQTWMVACIDISENQKRLDDLCMSVGND